MVIKTREKLIEVARQLFAHKGVENTTMNDIAAASDKGRRTIYTYFRNKREIYNAVIERESEQLVQKLREVADSDATASEKVRRFISSRLETMTVTGTRHDTLRSFFIRDFRRIDRIRKLVATKELEIFNRILRQGIDSGEFDAEQARRLPLLGMTVFQGLDYYIVKNTTDDVGQPARIKHDLTEFIVVGLTVRHKQ